ncbi:MAG: thiamine pyrophosphate-dependent enzyme [SAR324 cluster bacterium]|nr:thiamine pyrophosphate-dependent enzyme [SAR324 cluster bacterium]
MNSSHDFPETQEKRAQWFKSHGGVNAVVEAGLLSNTVSMGLTEVLVLGLIRQGVTKFLMILGHGSTEFGETLRVYESAGLVKGFQFRNEVEMAHTATALRWVYDEPCAVVTSIGPGALQAMAASIVSSSNGIGVYHIYGDETTHGEGYNMQQVPKREQGMFGQITSVMGSSYTLHTPQAFREALRRGATRVFHPSKAGPFFLNLPINTQPAKVTLRLDSLPERPQPFVPYLLSDALIKNAAALISKTSQVAIKAGGGSRKAAEALLYFAETSGAVVVLSPGSTGVLPNDHPQNMHVGGSKGTISGNYAMQEAELVIFVGSRGVCQSDCSGMGWPKAKYVINVNTDFNDALHYNNTLVLQGDAATVLKQLTQGLDKQKDTSEWLSKCLAKKQEWQAFKKVRFDAATIEDDIWKIPLLTQPQVIKIADDFARLHGAIKFFDAGDVQANGFQIVEDNSPEETFTDSGSSYMGFAVSALLSQALADEGRYGIALTGDGSFMMNPQILIDGIQHGVHGTILLLDNRRMAAISQLQEAQYGCTYRTNDLVEVDYVKMAQSIKGIRAFWGGTTLGELKKVLVEAYAHSGLSLIHVPVYHGPNPLGGMGAYGSWNVGNWCEEVQQKYIETMI